jgi:hypothetical protein
MKSGVTSRSLLPDTSHPTSFVPYLFGIQVHNGTMATNTGGAFPRKELVSGKRSQLHIQSFYCSAPGMPTLSASSNTVSCVLHMVVEGAESL